MFDHIRLPVSDYERSKRFYAAALQALGSGLLVEERAPDGRGGDAGFGSARRPQFWIEAAPLPARSTSHSWRRTTRRRARLPCGGARGRRQRQRRAGAAAHYHPNYFAAFVLDPDGHNVEAVCHAPGAFEDQFPGQ